MATVVKINESSDSPHVYVSCLTYLAAEAEREKRYGIAEILRAATIGIKKWSQDPIELNATDSDELIDSIVAAFSVVLCYRQIPADKMKTMLDIIGAMSGASIH